MFEKQDHLGRKIVFKGYEQERERVVVIIKRTNDYCIGLRYDIKDGKWAQGIYDLQTIVDALKYVFTYLNITYLDFIDVK